VTPGDTISYTFTVTNIGNVTLTNVDVADPSISVFGGPIPSLGVGASDSTTFTGSYVVTQADIDAGSFTNTATATGTPPTGPDVADTDDDTQTLTGDAALGLVKSLEDNADEDGSGTVTEGDTLTYGFVATNTGTVTLNGVTITDPLPGLSVLDCVPLQPAVLAPTGILSCTATYVVSAADATAGEIVNTATADSNETPPVDDTLITPVQQPQPQVCDVNGDGVVTQTDITLISRARGQSVPPGDPRDADGDGVVTFRDVKLCIPLRQ
jgi:uncharacterized repeat protein (TIGR01451 family)